MSSSKNSVLLVHGIDDTAKVFSTMMAYLSDRGWNDIHALDLVPNNGAVGLDELALQVQTYVNNHLAHVEIFDLVGFSMGGLVSRYYVQRLGGGKLVQHLVTISSPHNGTWTSYLRQNVGACQMRPESFFLQTLNESMHELEQVEFTSLWTPYDLMILPATSSQLPVGTGIKLSVLAHPLMLIDEKALATLATVLDTAQSTK